VTTTAATPVPLVDLAAQHAQVADEVAAGWADILASTAFVGGPAVAAFETAFARFTGAAHCVGVGNGTDAIEMALRALGIGLGDECIVPANTFIATAEAVARTGASPVLVDCHDDTALIDPAAAAAAVTSRTRAVLPVHLYGQTAEVDLLRDALPDAVTIVEDAAQAHGARRNGQGAGTLGRIAATSFYPGKNLGAYGDAGRCSPPTSPSPPAPASCASTDRPASTSIRCWASTAAWTPCRPWCCPRSCAASTAGTPTGTAPRIVTTHYSPPWTACGRRWSRTGTSRSGTSMWCAWPTGSACCPSSDAGIGAGIHYPTPVHLTGAFAGLGRGPGSFPVSERMANEILSLPLFPEITPEQQERVVEVLAAAVRA